MLSILPWGGVHVVLVLLLCWVERSEGFVASGWSGRVSPLGRPRCAARESHERGGRGVAWRHGRLVRRRSPVPSTPGFTLEATEGGGAEEDDDTQELTKGFYSEVAARLGKTAEGASKTEDDSEEVGEEEDSASQFDKAIYDELRERRDFGFEQDLGLELEKRNITNEAEVTKIVDAGLEQMPGVSSSTTFFPTAELTPREVVTTVFEALKNNDQPYHNHGVEVFVRFLSASSAMHGVEISGVARYLAENRNRAFMHWDAIAYPRPLTLSGGAKQNKAFQLVKLQDTMTGAWHSVSVYLTLDAQSNCWLLESCIVKGEL
ncbi:unnamed protein product [Pylaiella littoralis]